MFKENELRNQMKQANTDVHCAVVRIVMLQLINGLNFIRLSEHELHKFI